METMQPNKRTMMSVIRNSKAVGRIGKGAAFLALSVMASGCFSGKNISEYRFESNRYTFHTDVVGKSQLHEFGRMEDAIKILNANEEAAGKRLTEVIAARAKLVTNSTVSGKFMDLPENERISRLDRVVDSIKTAIATFSERKSQIREGLLEELKRKDSESVQVTTFFEQRSKDAAILNTLLGIAGLIAAGSIIKIIKNNTPKARQKRKEEMRVEEIRSRLNQQYYDDDYFSI